MLHERFGRDQHQILIRRMFHIHQESTVTDYVERFSGLIDQLKAYNPNIDMIYYTTHFVDGLREDIRAVIVVQRPQNLYTVYTLALLQEEVVEADPAKRKDGRRDLASYPRPTFKNAHPLPLPPGAGDHNPKPAEAGFTVSENAKTAEDKFRALRAYRRARGLCDHCAENGLLTISVLLLFAFTQCKRYWNSLLFLMKLMILMP